jgi:hypothetical protein
MLLLFLLARALAIIKGNGTKPTHRQGEQDKSPGETGWRNFRLDDFGHRGLLSTLD